MKNEKYRIREICGDWALDIPFPGSVVTIFFNSRANAELVKQILIHEDAHPGEAVPFKPSHFPDLTKMAPLTLEQLRKMDGQPVWVHVIDHTIFADKKDDFDGWGMCRKSWVRIWDSKRADIVHIDYDFEDYGKDWLAYAYPTAHIDREAWEKPCGMCGGKTTLYQHTNTTKLFMNTFWEAATLVTECMACPPYADCCMKGISANSAFKIKFCPECGRPLTEEAWAELEKRLRG